MKIRIRKIGKVPYVELIDLGEPLPIQKIIVGPGDNQQTRAEMALKLVEGTTIEIVCSEGWD